MKPPYIINYTISQLTMLANQFCINCSKNCTQCGLHDFLDHLREKEERILWGKIEEEDG